jgi:hypothetical protein
MNYYLRFFLLLLILFQTTLLAQSSNNPLLKKGWEELTKDNDNEAFRYFYSAYEEARNTSNNLDQAEALLCLGICSYGSDIGNGLQYAIKSLATYNSIAKVNPEVAETGRARCLQLISTIYSRQGKYKEAKAMSFEVAKLLEEKKEKSGTLGLAYSSIGELYSKEKKTDSAAYYFKLALDDFKASRSTAYLPGAYIKMGELELKNQNYATSLDYFKKALNNANVTQNKQAQVSSLLGLGNWELSNNKKRAAYFFEKANSIAMTLSDKTFEIKTLESLIALKKQEKKFYEISLLQDKLAKIKDLYYSLERDQISKNLENQFKVIEKNRQLELLSKEKEIIKLSNYLLLFFIGIILIISISGYFYLKNSNKRNKELIQIKQNLLESLEKQKAFEEIQFRNDIEHKENQLSAITLKMIQKNELLNEMKEVISDKEIFPKEQLLKIMNQHYEQNNKWGDFDLYFESINKNFYTRLKELCPDISTNDLKVCALIRLNMSIKEMSSILNISPDSVKTARYRLRKKLLLSADENLMSFILSI